MIGRVLNLPLMANPINWVIVTLMVVLGSLAVHLIFASSNAADLGGDPTGE